MSYPDNLVRPGTRTKSVSTSGRSLFSRAIRRSETDGSFGDEQKAPKGPLGLTTLYEPGDTTILDLIFVHGLNGGSQSTWSKGGDRNFWPREWLPHDNAFRDVRIHSFGYSSSLSRGSILNIQDFASNLLAFIQHSPIASSDSPVPIIFVAHSMGGLVVKKAYILSQQNAEYEAVAKRVRGMFFLATPHQGAGIAQLLDRLLSYTPGSRPFVGDLFPQSAMLQSINEEFPRYSKDLHMFSFYETQAMYYGIGKGLIVEKHCAVMNYRNEKRTYLDANHRDMARFSTPTEPSYCLVRNALATTIDTFRTSLKPERQKPKPDDFVAVVKFFGLTDPPKDDYIANDSQKFPGSCQWLIQSENFQRWRDAMSSKTLWLRGRPGSGKSVMAAHVINHLESLSFDCSYFFFKDADKSKSNSNVFLRSVALQMAVSNPEILSCISRLSNNWSDPPVDKFDHGPVWRRIFVSGMLNIKLNRPHFWIIDSIDECEDGLELMNFFVKAQDLWPLRIFITARAAAADYSNGFSRKMDIISDTISEDNNADISAFITAHLENLPGANIAAQQELANRISNNSNGCFLWVNLVLRELRQVHTSAEITQVLISNLTGMDALYARILENMSRARYGKELARNILLWVTTAFRPLSIDELQYAIEKGINDSIDDVEKSISSLCGHLVYIEKSQKVQLVHLSAREYLTRADNESEFAISRPVAHKTLALVCLRILSGSRSGRGGLRGASRAMQSGGAAATRDMTPLHDYASTYVFKHLLRVLPTDDEVFIELAKFLGSHEVLSWIEKLASTSDLQRIYRAGKYCLTMVRRRIQHAPPIGIRKQVDVIERWGNDLIRLVNKFGRQLTHSPGVIHHLIPPFCPPESSLRKQFGRSYRGLSVHGPVGQDWDDCLSTVSYPRISKPMDMESSQRYVALALSDGRVVIYQSDTLVEKQSLLHGEPVWSMAFGDNQDLLATAGAKRLKVWDLNTSNQVFDIPISSLCMTLTFLSDDSFLWLALKNNTILIYDMIAKRLREDPIDWSRSFEEDEAQLRLRRPTIAKFCSKENVLAIIYRGENILLWGLEEGGIVDIYEKDHGSLRHGESVGADGPTTVWSIVFGATIEDNLLVASYSDGDVVLFSTDTGERCGSIDGINALTVACSPDGRTLATADSQGNIFLFDLRTLQFLYRLNFDTDAIRSKRVAFTADNLRLLNIRGNQFRVWDPTVLLRQEFEDENSETMSMTTNPQCVEYELSGQIPITCLTSIRRQSAVLCGKEDGSVHVYENSADPEGQILFIQTPNCAVTIIHFDEDAGIITCCDIAGRIVARELHYKQDGRYVIGEPMVELRSESVVSQVLSSGRCGRILVSSERHDTLWFLQPAEGKDQVSRMKGTLKPSWLELPGNGELLIHVESNIACFHKWSTLERLRSVKLSTHENTPVLVDSILTFQHQQYFATVHDESQSSSVRQPRYHLWDLRDFVFNEYSASADRQDSTVIFPLFHVSASNTKIDVLVGVANDRAVFVGVDNWVYSTDMIDYRGSSLNSGTEPSATTDPVFTRHFFFPDDWSSSTNRLLVDIRRSGEIIFIKRWEVAVIRRGLEVAERGMFNAHRGLAVRQPLIKRPAEKRHLSA